MACNENKEEYHISARQLPGYYKCIENRTAIKDFDDPANFEDLSNRVRAAGARNFLLDFGVDEAWCGFDLSYISWTVVLDKSRPEASDTRWINIWAPNEQVDLIKALAAKYGFSPRLAELMCSPRRKPPLPVKIVEVRNPFSFRRGRAEVTEDVERGPKLSDINNPALDLNHYDLVSSMWNWSSVDIGSKYFCLGYNSVYNVRLPGTWMSMISDDEDMPRGERLWTWLILCDDRTVISIIEDPFLAEAANSDVEPIRHNLLNVFRHLSKAVDPSTLSAISLVPLRYPEISAALGSSKIDGDTPGLLFYYLFDDWQTTYSLLAKGYAQHTVRLNKLRGEMMKDADLEHVNELHHIGRELAVLKRLYRSYDLILERMLANRGRAPTLQITPFSTPTLRKISKNEIHAEVGIYLTSPVRVRFERLRDRIKLYALTSLEENSELKESLMMMNFNLISIKESNSVERLTRTTILLAKATILFLPVSLMTTYFQTPLVKEEYTVKDYWISFTVVFVISFLVILGYGRLSGTVEGNMVYRPIEKVLFDSFKRKKPKRQ